MDMTTIKKQKFTLEAFTFECGKTIPITLGYETYGQLNEDKSNVILVNHYFSASSHAAGKYSPEDLTAGYWDALIGPGKAVDTNKYFVISIDNLANVQVKNENIITTGPRTIDPKTGKRYGMDFPPFTFRDMTRIQHEFLKNQLGIDQLYAVMGASAGGFISLYWTILYPGMVRKMIGVITNPQNPIQTSFNVCQHAMRAIELDPLWNNGQYEDDKEPVEGLQLAVQMMNVGAFTYEFFENTYKRDSSDETSYESMHEMTRYEKDLYSAVQNSSSSIDASHWYYTARATMMHDIAYGSPSLQEALKKIEANVLMISCTDDQLQPTEYNREMVEELRNQGKQAELFEFPSVKGHMAGILDTHLFSHTIYQFLL